MEKAKKSISAVLRKVLMENSICHFCVFIIKELIKHAQKMRERLDKFEKKEYNRENNYTRAYARKRKLCNKTTISLPTAAK